MRRSLPAMLLMILLGSAAAMASGEPVIIDCGNLALLTARPSGKPVIQSGKPGGLDAGYPGDAAQLLISSGAAGKKYYATPDAVAVTVQTTGTALMVTLQHDAYGYGTSRLEVLWDEAMVATIDCRLAGETAEARTVQVPIPAQRAAAGRHVLTLTERSGADGQYGVIDAIAFGGDPGLVVVTNSGRVMAPARSSLKPTITPDPATLPLRLERSGAALRSDFGSGGAGEFAPGWEVTGSATGTACVWDGALYVPTPPALVHSLALPVRGASGTFGLRQNVDFPDAGSLLVDLMAYPERDSAAILVMCEQSAGPAKLYLARFKGQIALSDGKGVWNLAPADGKFHRIRLDFANGLARAGVDGQPATATAPWPAFDTISIGHVQPYEGYGVGVAVRSIYLTGMASAPARLRVVSGDRPVPGRGLTVKAGDRRLTLTTDARGEVSMPTGLGAAAKVTVREGKGGKSVSLAAALGDVWVWNLAAQATPRPAMKAPAGAGLTEVWLDCGAEGTGVAPGFAALTATGSTAKGCGWLPGARLTPTSLPGYDDPLVSDSLDVEQPGATASLGLDLLPGDYSVTLLCGSADLLLDFAVRCDGQPVAAVTQPRTGGWAMYSFPIHVARRGTRLDFDVAASLSLAGLVVVPLHANPAEARRIRTFHDGIRDALSVAMAEAQGVSAEAPPPDPEPAVDAAAQARGYVLFGHSYMRPIYSTSRPTADDMARPVAGFGCAGEFEPLTVSVWPLRDLVRARVTVSDLQRDGGPERIPAAAMDVKAVRIWPQQWGTNTYRNVPELIETLPDDGLTLPAGRTRTIWMTLRVPDAQTPGDYRGQVRVTCAGTTATVPVWFKVLPIRRDPIDDLAMGMYWSWRQSAGGDLALARKQFADMRRHGCTTLCLEAPAPLRKVDGQWTIDCELLDKLLKLCQEVGFTQPIPIYDNGWPATTEAWEAGARLLVAEGKKRGWPELLFYPVDEPGNNPEALATAIRLCQAVKKVPGARTYITTNGQGKDAAALDPWLDVRTYQHLSYNPTEAARTLASGDTLWCYTGPPHGFVYPRLNDGLWWFRSQMTGHFWWHYCWPVGDPWFDFDGSGDWCASYPGPTGPVATVEWECIREGLDDLRYFRTLRSTIARARTAGKATAQADEAEAYLTALCDRIPADGAEIAKALSAIPSEEFAAIRWEVVKRTLALDGAISGTGQTAAAEAAFAQTLPQAPYRTE